jgi:hypothetical protein
VTEHREDVRAKRTGLRVPLDDPHHMLVSLLVISKLYLLTILSSLYVIAIGLQVQHIRILSHLYPDIQAVQHSIVLDLGSVDVIDVWLAPEWNGTWHPCACPLEHFSRKSDVWRMLPSPMKCRIAIGHSAIARSNPNL